ncbi:MAG: PPA1309 family protein [Kineosporiaceae bacterium]
MTANPSREQAVLTLVRELEQHVAADGWDGPMRLFALVRTAGALDRDEGLADRLPPAVVAAARADADHLTAVEQDDLPQVSGLEDLLGRITWPHTVDGTAVVIERVVLPPSAEADLDALADDDADAAAAAAADHPDRIDVRLAAAVLRDGSSGCAVRSRSHDADTAVAVGPDLIPDLISALRTTLEN